MTRFRRVLSHLSLSAILAAALTVLAVHHAASQPGPKVPLGARGFQTTQAYQEYYQSREWHRSRNPGYQQLYHGYRPAHPNPAEIMEKASKNYLHVHHAAVKHQPDTANQALLMVHVPVDASIWFDGQPTTQKGDLRWFDTAPLEPGYGYYYTVRAVWHEDGKWVSDSEKVVMRAGDVVCIDLRPATEKHASVADNLSKLSPVDRTLAEEQKYCAVQNDNELGSMGVPAKIMVKGQPVFLCCSGCDRTAQSNSERTLAKVKELRTKAKAIAPPP
jgi:uncharacterized protein (TIGR03000 family)